jgi:predicted transposase/invertase (TIGR01784 family)
MPIDNLCKYLAEQSPRQFVQWLIPDAATDNNIRVLKTELSNEPIRADALTLLQTTNRILHIEFQTKPDANMPFRMLDYWVRLYRQYQCEIQQIVVYLKPSGADAVFINRFDTTNTQHQYRIIRLWEEEPEPLLADTGLLPLASLARTDNPEVLLRRVAIQVDTIKAGDLQRSISACCQVIAGLRFDRELIRSIFKEETMRESVIYQDILQQGESGIILKQLKHKFGAIHLELQAKIQQLSTTQLEALGEALLDFTSPEDLSSWLEQN